MIQLSYDPIYLDQVISITDGLSNPTHFAYDSYGNLHQVTDAENNLTTYVNDYAGRTIEVIDAENIKTTFTYDAIDNPKDVSDFTKNGTAILRAIITISETAGHPLSMIVVTLSATRQASPRKTWARVSVPLFRVAFWQQKPLRRGKAIP